MASTATMDFFESQDVARKKTSLLIGYYVLAVVFIIAAVYVAFVATFVGIEAKTASGHDSAFRIKSLWKPDIFLWVVGGTVLVVLTGTAYKISQLSGGGESVAEMLGGRIINSNTRNPDERKVLNVVEEMAIASGSPVPRVFLLENEMGINAFAAGFAASDAVIGVTRGCIKVLSRDELQGVIAHEFSHILNGDMRLNIRLVGILNGILVIGLIGFWIFRMSLYTGSSRSRDRGGGKIPVVLFGLAVMVIGYVGVFFGKLIKSAVSRQREYLADASAVQFTRNPDGISGALKKIAGYDVGSRIENMHAEEASHFFFSNGLTSSLISLMATHPPMDERIRRLDPSFSGLPPGGSDGGARSLSDAASGFAAGASVRVEPDAVVSSIGAPRQEHLNYASALIGKLPDGVLSAIREPFGARAAVYCLLLNRDSVPRDIQLRRLEQHADPLVNAETRRILPLVEGAGREMRLPLLDLAMPALKALSHAQYRSFIDNVQHLVAADEQVDLFEYTLQRMIMRHLAPVFEGVRATVVKYHKIEDLRDACTLLISCIAHWGSVDGAASEAFGIGMSKLALSQCPEMLSADQCGLAVVDDALVDLAKASHSLKKVIIGACTACIAFDGEVSIVEAELLRSISDSLDCPMPPLLPGRS